jgi:hypothetical protein
MNPARQTLEATPAPSAWGQPGCAASRLRAACDVYSTVTLFARFLG